MKQATAAFDLNRIIDLPPFSLAKQEKDEMLILPVAEKIPHKTTIHGYDRVDNYHWMRLTDKQKLAKDPDAQTQKVLDNLKAENAYKEVKLKHTEKFQQYHFYFTKWYSPMLSVVWAFTMYS